MDKRRVSRAARRLIEQCQRINFGRIEYLPIRNGDPVVDPLPRIVREVRLPGDNGPRPEAVLGDFALKRQVEDMLAEFARIGDGVVEVLIVKHGLPFSMHVVEPPSDSRH